MTTLTLDLANQMIAAAFAKAASLSLKPLTIAVLDAGGHLVALQRADNSSILRPQIAMGKAYGALSVGMGSRSLHNLAETRAHFLEGLNAVSGGRIVAVPGGVLIKSAEGHILGAVGITGDTSDNDEACAIAGIEAVGFAADGG